MSPLPDEIWGGGLSYADYQAGITRNQAASMRPGATPPTGRRLWGSFGNRTELRRQSFEEILEQRQAFFPLV